MEELKRGEPTSSGEQVSQPVVEKGGTNTVAFGVKEFVGIRRRIPGEKHALSERRVGDDYYRKGQRWVLKDRLIDWENDRYSETVTDQAPVSGVRRRSPSQS